MNGELPTLWWDDFGSRCALIDSSNLGTAPLFKENNPCSHSSISSSSLFSSSSYSSSTSSSSSSFCWFISSVHFFCSLPFIIQFFTFFLNEISPFYESGLLQWASSVGNERQWKQMRMICCVFLFYWCCYVGSIGSTESICPVSVVCWLVSLSSCHRFVASSWWDIICCS